MLEAKRQFASGLKEKIKRRDARRDQERTNKRERERERKNTTWKIESREKYTKEEDVRGERRNERDEPLRLLLVVRLDAT